MNERLFHYEVNKFRCIGCSYCKLNCKFKSIQSNHSNIMIINYLTCTKCGICSRVCPLNAINVIEDINEK